MWLWIALSIVLSLLFLNKKKVSFHNLIWILLPIDFYGIEINGFLLKPYMIFAVLLLFLGKNLKEKKFSASAFAFLLFMIVAIFITDLLNGSVIDSVRQHLLFLFVVICAFSYIANINEVGEYKQISDVIVATSLGYGAVYILAYILFSCGIGLSGIIAYSRYEPGMIMQFSNNIDGVYAISYRLRGLLIDPNSLICSFLPSLAISATQLFSENSKYKLKYMFSIIISSTCIMLTNSRMAIICFVFTLLLIAIYILRTKQLTRLHLFIITFLLLILLLFIAYIFSLDSNFLTRAVESLTQSFSYRSSLTDEYGRFNIWKENWNKLVENNLWFGVGQNQIQYYSPLKRAIHNTWLEWICGTGIIVGTIVNIVFIFGWHISKNLLNSIRGDVGLYDFIKGVSISYIGILLALCSVDNITNSYLVLLLAIIFYFKQSIKSMFRN